MKSPQSKRKAELTNFLTSLKTLYKSYQQKDDYLAKMRQSY